MANLRNELEEEEARFGEPIEAIAVGVLDTFSTRYGSDTPKADENVVLSREAGLAKIDRDYDNGFGGADCHTFYAWTKSRVFLVHEYDGATGIVWVPRHPTALKPEFGGQC